MEKFYFRLINDTSIFPETLNLIDQRHWFLGFSLLWPFHLYLLDITIWTFSQLHDAMITAFRIYLSIWKIFIDFRVNFAQDDFHAESFLVVLFHGKGKWPALVLHAFCKTQRSNLWVAMESFIFFKIARVNFIRTCYLSNISYLSFRFDRFIGTV